MAIPYCISTPLLALRRSSALTAGALALCLASSATALTPAPDASRIGRSASAKAPEFQALYDYEGRALTLADATFPYETRLHRAHVLMLHEQQIITRNEAATILKGLAIIDAKAGKDATLRAYLPDEKALIVELGPVAGKLHTGRSRNDLANTVNRMFYRDQINSTVEALIALRLAAVNKAAEHLDTVMVVYTHRKQAQPITLAHYLMAHAESLGKSIDRYEQLYARTNLSPLGAAASAGSGWPLKRERSAALLGFDGLVVNTIEGTAGWDHITEFAADNAIYMSGLSRLASEIQLWSSDEYNAAELDGAFAGTSSIMPQKRNPDSLERTRYAAAGTLGTLVSILASVGAIEYQHSGTRVALDPRSIDSVMAATRAMTGVLRTLRPNKAQMLKHATEGFATMTDLTDTIVRESGLSFREAHELMAQVINAAVAQGKTANQIDLGMIQAAAQAHDGPALTLSAQALRDALDPLQNVARRNGTGGPAPSSVREMIEHTLKDIAAEYARLQQRRAHLAQAHLALREAESALIGSAR